MKITPRQQQEVHEAYKDLKLLFQLTEPWHVYPKVVFGHMMTMNIVRIYIAVVGLNWSQKLCARIFGTSPYSVRNHLRRVEDARELPWFDEIIGDMETKIKEVKAAIRPKEENDNITEITKSSKLATPLGTK